MREKIASIGLVASMLLGVLGTSFGIFTIATTQNHPAGQITNVYNTYNNQTSYNQTFVNNTYVNNTHATQNESIIYSQHFINLTLSNVNATKRVFFTIPVINRTRISFVVAFYKNWNKTDIMLQDDAEWNVYLTIFDHPAIGSQYLRGYTMQSPSWMNKYATYIPAPPNEPTYMIGLMNGTGCHVDVSADQSSHNYPDPFEISVAIWYETW